MDRQDPYGECYGQKMEHDPPADPSSDHPLTPEAHAKQLKRILLDLLSGWRFAAWSSLGASERYYELVEEKTDEVKQALEDGGSPYQAVVFVLAPFFLAPDEQGVRVLEQGELPEGTA